MRAGLSRGMPAAGSLQDRIACEMVLRERRRHIAEHSYTGRIIAAGLKIPERVFQLWTSLLSLEVFQENYAPHILQDKQEALQLMQTHQDKKREGQVRMFQKLSKLTAEDQDMRPATAEDRERLKRKLRAHRLKMSTPK